MFHDHLQLLAVAFCLLNVLPSDSLAAEDAARDAQAMEGLWSGPWGLSIEPDGIVHQPVMAELLIKGDHVEMHAFPDTPGLTGTIRLDTRARQILVTPTVEAGRPPAEVIVYGFVITDDSLRLTDKDKRSIDFRRHGTVDAALANAVVEFVVATGINDAGDLLVTKFTRLQAGQAGETFLEPREDKLKTRQAKLFQVEETGTKEITVDEARRLIRGSTPVVVAWRHEERPTGDQLYKLWKGAGEPAPDSGAVLRTFARTLRPGTLVFILSARENVPVP
ncbi:MAG: hypothetical protein ACHRHE_19980 [Tepidisphaerales bacterium]